MKKLKKIVLNDEPVEASVSSTTKQVLDNSEGNRSGSGSGNDSGSGSGDDWGGLKIKAGSCTYLLCCNSAIVSNIVVSWTEGSVTGVPVMSELSVRVLNTDFNYPVVSADDPSLSKPYWRQGYVAHFNATFCWREYLLNENGVQIKDENNEPIIVPRSYQTPFDFECPVEIINETSGNNLP